jgi:hypothetical protein
VAGFDLPLVLRNGGTRLRLLPTDQWKTTEMKGDEAALVTEDGIKNMYYIGVKPVSQGGK